MWNLTYGEERSIILVTFQILQLLPSLCTLNSPTDIIFSRLRSRYFNKTYKKEAQLMYNDHPECPEYTKLYG